MDLTQINKGEFVKVVEIMGGQNFKDKVDAIGLRVGSHIVKLSTQVLRGPVTIKLGNTKIALGYGMASKILVESKKT